jgi:3-oxoadipate enol-lactonase
VRESSGPFGAPTLVLLHGLGATGLLNWRHTLPALARNYRVVVVDHRGHGRGIRIREPFRLADCADDVAALGEELRLGRFFAVGYSMGGPIGQLLWRRHPDQVAGLVFCATASRFSSGDRRRMGFAVGPVMSVFGRVAPRSYLRRMARDWISDRIVDPAMRERILSEIRRSDPVSIAQAAAAVLRFDSRAWIEDVDVPTSVVITERDRLVRPDAQRALAAKIAGTETFSIAGDHSVCVTDPALFVPALEHACASVVKRASR